VSYRQDWFKTTGARYQTRINVLLRAYMEENQIQNVQSKAGMQPTLPAFDNS
jgi:hypothetical protein